MNIGEIIKDAVRYPLSDWKKIIILGIIIEISYIAQYWYSYDITNIGIILILAGIGLLVGFLVNGYLIRILKSSLDGAWELPGFNAWKTMFIDGFKVFAVFFIYLILPVLAMIFLLLLLGSDFPFRDSIFATDLASTGMSPLSFFVNDVTSVVPEGILSYPGLFFILGPEIIALPSFIYTILIIPVFLLAISNMAYSKGEFNSAFSFHEIIDDIKCRMD